MNQDAIADAGVGQPVWLIQPTANSARMAINLFSKRFQVEIIGEKIRV
jgi:hypothetical protein